jgi:ATP-dependent exoDNAse (exonuclease V) alpha subunit
MRKITFITGAAGTGKSYELRKRLETETRAHLKVAPTGLAAINIGGSTIHRTFGVDIDSGFVKRHWPEVEVVYIDECSMVGAKLFEAVLEGAPNAEIVMVGDMAQLPPVNDRYWFEAPSLDLNSVEKVTLTKNYRQAGDLEYAEVLNSIRDGSVTPSKLKLLTKAVADPSEDAVVLAFRNLTVQEHNAKVIEALPGQPRTSMAIYEGVMKPGDCIAEEKLTVKPGARIIMLSNDLEGRWVNGTSAVVESIEPGAVRVRIGESVHKVERNVWRMNAPFKITPQRAEELIRSTEFNPDPVYHREVAHWLNTGVEFRTIGTCKQYPFKLAYAMTIHKSQGMSLDRASVITSGFRRMHGIGYVALSRVTSAPGLTLDMKLTTKDFKFDNKLTDFI